MLKPRLFFWTLAVVAAGTTTARVDARRAGAETPATSVGTVLGQLAASMAPGTWAELPTLDLNAGILEDVGGHHILQYTDDAVWDPVGERVLFLGQGHASNWDNDPTTTARFIAYGAGTNRWTVMLPVIPSENVGHGYDHSALDAARGEFFHRPFNSLTVYRYRLATGEWDALPAIPQPARQVAGALEYFPEPDGLLFVDGDWGVWFWRRATNAWELLANTNGTIDPELPSLPMAPYHNLAQHSPVHHRIVFGGGNDSNDLYLIAPDLSIVTQSPAPHDVGVAWGSVFTLDPVSGDYLVFTADENVWQYDPVAAPGGVWTPVVGPRPPFLDIGPDEPSIFGCVATPVPTYGVTLFLKYDGSDSKVFLYKHTPPTPPLFADGFESGDTSAWSATVP